MSDRRTVSAIVLAGGRSARFGRDKLREPFEGRPLVAHSVEAVRSIVTEILVIVAPDATDPLAADPATAPGSDPTIRLLHDPEPFGGPSVALLAALEVAREPMVLVVGGDMPRLDPAVLRLLIDRLAASEPGDVDAVALVQRSERRPLPAVLRVGAATVAARRAIGSGDRSLRGVLAGLRVRDLAEAEWRPLDPDAATLLDIDEPADLTRLRD